MTSTRHCLFALMLALAATPVAAQDEGAEDDAMDAALQNFGYAGGAAWQCAEDSDKGALVDSAMHVYTRLTQLFGTDRAFFFSAAFGAGTVDEIDAGDCEGYASEFSEGLMQAEAEGAE